MLDADVVMVERPCLILRQHDDLASAARESLEHALRLTGLIFVRARNSGLLWLLWTNERAIALASGSGPRFRARFGPCSRARSPTSNSSSDVARVR
jgi:hypothetical protein